MPCPQANGLPRKSDGFEALEEPRKTHHPTAWSNEGGALGGVDSKDSLLGANQIQGFFFGGSLVERCGMEANGAADHRAA